MTHIANVCVREISKNWISPGDIVTFYLGIHSRQTNLSTLSKFSINTARIGWIKPS